MYARYSPDVVCQPVLRLFFKSKPAVWRISSCEPSPWVRRKAR